jgi:hypothetical protein
MLTNHHEYYSAHYFAELLAGDLKEKNSRRLGWNGDETRYAGNFSDLDQQRQVQFNELIEGVGECTEHTDFGPSSMTGQSPPFPLRGFQRPRLEPHEKSTKPESGNPQ